MGSVGLIIISLLKPSVLMLYFSWDIAKLRKKLVLMYSIPFDQNLYSNWIGVGIFDLSDTGDKFAKMYYQPEESFKRKAFYTDVTPVVYDGDPDFSVEATCGTTHQPTINVSQNKLINIIISFIKIFRRNFILKTRPWPVPHKPRSSMPSVNMNMNSEGYYILA